MKDDMISRQAALNCVYGTSPNKIKGRIAELPSATDTNVVGNLIDRQAALDALGERPVVWSDNDDYTLGERNQYDMDRLAIETVPSAQPGWIPCKTKLPEKDGSYLVTANNGQMAIYLFVKGMSENYWKQWGATAWMSLPTPYRAGGQDG